MSVYFAQVNRRDWMERIQKLLRRRGIYSEVLRQNTCKPDERESWYRSFVQRCWSRGQEPVLLANGNLAEGLPAMEVDDGDLMDALMKAVAQGRPNRVEWSGDSGGGEAQAHFSTNALT